MSAEALGGWSDWLLWAGFVLGGLALISSSISAVLASRASEIVQAEARAQFAQHSLDIAEANARTADANERTENLRIEALALQQRMMPRRIVFGSGDPGASERSALFADMKRFAGTPAVIEVVAGDAEAKELARLIALALNEASWSFSEKEASLAGMWGEGVHVQTLGDSSEDPAPVFIGDKFHPGSAAEALAALLRFNIGPWGVFRVLTPREIGGIKSRTWPDGVPPETVLIKVGMRPLSAFPPIWQDKGPTDDITNSKKQ